MQQPGSSSSVVRSVQIGERPLKSRPAPARHRGMPLVSSTRHNQNDPVISVQYRKPAMPTVVYSLENAIDSFFSEAGASSSKLQCDDLVRRRYGEQILPVKIQGSSSYTVIAGPSGNKIIQFREQAALLDMNMLALAKQVHGDVVPRCSELGWVGEPNGSQLAIYEMDRLPGENYIIARPSFTRSKRLNTVHSLARFVKTLFLHPLFTPTC